MERLERVKEIESLMKKNKDIDRFIFEMGPLYPELFTEKKKNFDRIGEIYDNAIRVLIATIKTPKEGKEDHYCHYYYLVDLDKTMIRGSEDPNGICDVDMREFFSNFKFPQTEKGFVNFSSHSFRYTRAIMRALLEDMFSRKDFQNWDEVKQDLLRIQDDYEMPKTDKLPVYQKKANQNTNNG